MSDIAEQTATAAALALADTELGKLTLPNTPALIWGHYKKGDVPAWLWTWDLWSLDDVDYVAALSPGFRDVRWLFDSGNQFGCCDTEEHTTPNGWRLVIGHHA